MSRTYDIYSFGNALVDTEIKVSEDDLATLGIKKGMMSLVDRERQLEIFDLLKTNLVKANRASGGSAANSVYAAARFGASAFFSCKIADDADGAFFLRDMEKAGVKHNYLLQHSPGDGVTGKCLVMISPDAERSMNTFLGINEVFSTDELVGEAQSDARYLFMEGYAVTAEGACEAATSAIAKAKAEGVQTVLSFSDPVSVTVFKDNMKRVVGDGVDFIFANEVEAMEWTSTNTVKAAVERMKNHAKRFAVTRSGEGSILWDGNELTEIPPHRVQAIDTNGAGDMYAGAFLYALTRGESFPVAGRFASLAAGTIVANYGPRLAPEGYSALRAEFFGD
ncbi:MAG: adenosine kinase [Gammaproteobacteria bacterium]|nr:MAG: adenosine kinase [Gammaproteobacteria bacterium]